MYIVVSYRTGLYEYMHNPCDTHKVTGTTCCSCLLHESSFMFSSFLSPLAYQNYINLILMASTLDLIVLALVISPFWCGFLSSVTTAQCSVVGQLLHRLTLQQKKHTRHAARSRPQRFMHNLNHFLPMIYTVMVFSSFLYPGCCFGRGRGTDDGKWTIATSKVLVWFLLFYYNKFRYSHSTPLKVFHKNPYIWWETWREEERSSSVQELISNLACYFILLG
jgi:hypothetical protein